MRIALRKEWAAAIVCVLVLGLIDGTGTNYPAADLTIAILQAGLSVFVLLRYGLVALIALSLVSDLLFMAPRTLDFSQWYAPMGMLPLVAAALIAVYGFRVSLAGRPLSTGELE